MNELLVGGFIDSVIHVVPRKTLRDQVEDAYAQTDEFNPGGYRLLRSSNDAPLYSRDEVGVVCSFDQLAANLGLYLDEARRRRVGLVLDEVQFLGDEENASWAKASVALAELCRAVLAMSGTIWRHDSRRIPIVGYTEPDASGRIYVKADIDYDLEDAIADKSITPVDFILRDGDVRWSFGAEEIEATLSEAEPKHERAALRTFLQRDETWQAVVDDALAHWTAHREQVYPSRLIAIALDQKHAKAIKLYIESKGFTCALAVSDNDDAHELLDTFRKHGRPEILVTVGMASVGFDAPDVTHLAYLTNWRSLPNFMQAIARAMRIDYRCSVPPEQQHALVFVPDDRRMRMMTQWVREQSDRGIAEREKRTVRENTLDADPRAFYAIEAVPGAVAFEGNSGRLDDALELEEFMKGPGAGLSPSKARAILDWQRSRQPTVPRAPAPSKRKGGLRAELHHESGRCDKRHTWTFGTTTKLVYARFGRLTDGATEAELLARLAFVRSIP